MMFSRPSASPEGAFATAPPAFSEGEAAALVRVQYGLSGAVRMLAAERDQNFGLETGDGRAFVLKIANEAEDPAVVDLQIRGLLHIAARDPDLAVPRVVPARDGAPVITVFGPDGAAHLVRLLTFLTGVPMAEGPRSVAQRQAAGAAAARLGLALADFHHPGARHHLLWDLRHAGDLAPLVHHIADDALRARVADVFDRFATAVEPVFDTLRRQVVHNDLNPSNILVAPGDPDRIVGLFDFGDMVETALVNDVAVAASYQVTPEGDPLDGVAQFLAGYAAVRALTDAEVRLLPDLVATRMAMTLTVASWRAARYPENRAYLLRNTPVAAGGLIRLAGLDPEAVHARLAAVAGRATP